MFNDMDVFRIWHNAMTIASFILDVLDFMPNKNLVVRDKIPDASTEAGS